MFFFGPRPYSPSGDVGLWPTGGCSFRNPGVVPLYGPRPWFTAAWGNAPGILTGRKYYDVVRTLKKKCPKLDPCNKGDISPAVRPFTPTKDSTITDLYHHYLGSVAEYFVRNVVFEELKRRYPADISGYYDPRLLSGYSGGSRRCGRAAKISSCRSPRCVVIEGVYVPYRSRLSCAPMVCATLQMHRGQVWSGESKRREREIRPS